MASHRKLQRKLLLVKILQNARRRRKEIQQKIHFLLTVSECYYWRFFFYCCSFNFFRENRRSLPRLPLNLVLHGQLVEYLRQKVVSLLINYRTLQHWKPRRKEHANLNGKQPCLFSTILDPSAFASHIPGRHAQRSSWVINRLNAHADTRENTFPKFMH